MQLFGSRGGGLAKSFWRHIDEAARAINPFLLIAAIALAMLDLLYYAQWVVTQAQIVIQAAGP